MISREKFHRHGKNITVIRKIIPNMIVYAVIATDSVAARGLVNGWCLPRSGRRDILSVAITAFIFIRVILRIIIIFIVFSEFCCLIT